jgi:superfamily II DNA or RNA helicase
MARQPTLTYDRGTLILHPPPRGSAWAEFATWDDRIEKFRIPARCYPRLIQQLGPSSVVDQASQIASLALTPADRRQPYPHQQEACDAWLAADRQGVVVLPTGSGKSYLAQMAIAATQRSTLIVVPTLDLMHQWYANLEAAFPGAELGLLGGGSRDRTAILIATYDSAAIQAETLGNRYGLLIFDECHHLPSDFSRVIADYSIAPHRLGLTATPDRSDGRHSDLDQLIGPILYRKTAAELSGHALADYEVIQITVQLGPDERQRYNDCIAQRNRFLQQSKISLGSLNGWQRFIQASAQTPGGRQAMLAHQEAKAIALGTNGKLEVLADRLAEHFPDRILIFTHDNKMVYRISQTFLIPAITHQTPVKERHEILTRFRDGRYSTLVVANVLDEGVDVPEARIAIFLAGTGSTRQFIQRLGRILRRGDGNKQAILYEVITEDSLEQGSSNRRHGEPYSAKPQPTKPQPTKPGQLSLLPESPKSPTPVLPLWRPGAPPDRIAAEAPTVYNPDVDQDTDW